MASDLTISLANRPGTLAQLGEVLGGAGINIEGVAGFDSAETGDVHILVDDADMTREALNQAGIDCGPEREVEVLSVIDQPGELGRHLRRAADAGINVDLVYLATSNRLVVGSHDVEGLRRAIHGTG